MRDSGAVRAATTDPAFPASDFPRSVAKIQEMESAEIGEKHGEFGDFAETVAKA